MADGSIIIDTKLDESGLKKGIEDIKKVTKKIDVTGIDKDFKKASEETEKLAKSLKNVDASKIKKDINGLDGEFRSASMKMSKEFEEAAKKSESSIANMKTKISGHLSGIGTMTKTSLIGMTTVVAGIGAAGIGLGGAIAKIGGDFESQMSRVKAISGATTEEFKQLQDQAIQLGADTSFSSSEAAKGMGNLASAGLSTNEIMAAMPGMLDLAASSGEDLASSSDIAASALRGFGLEADQAGHVADVLAKNAAETNAAVGDTGEALKFIAPVAHSMGLSIEEVTAAIGELANSGIKGTMAGTTLRSSLTRLASPSKEAAGAMKELGFNAFDSQGKLKNLSDIMGEYNKALEGKTDQQKQDYTATIFGQEAMSGMLVLMQGGKEGLDKLTESYKKSDGAAKEMATTMKDNLKGSIDQLKGSLESLGLQIYYSVNNPMKGIVDEANNMVNKLSDAFKNGGFDGLTEALGDVFAQIVKDIAQNTPKIIDGAVNVIKSFVKGIKDNSSDIAKGSADIVVALADGIIELTPQLLDVGIEIIAKLAKGIADNTPTLAPKIVKLVKSIAKVIADNLPEIIKIGVTILTGITQGLIQSIPEIIKAIPEINIALLNAVKNTNWGNIGKEIIMGIVTQGNTDGKNFAEWAKIQVKSIKDTFKNGGLKEAIKQTLATLNPSLNAEGVNFTVWAKTQVKSLKDTFKNGGLKAVAKQIVDDLTPNLSQGIKTQIDKIKAEIEKLKTEIPAKINEVIANVKQTITNKVEEIKQYLSTKIKEIVDNTVTFIKELPGKIATTLGEALGEFLKWGVDVQNYLSTNVPKWIEDIKTWFSELPGKIKESLDNAYNNFIAWGNDMINQAETSANNTIKAVTDWFAQLPSKIEEWLNNTITNIVAFGENMKTEATTAGTNFFNGIVEEVEKIPDRMLSVGENIVAGLKSGISNSWNNMTGWLGGLCNNFITGVNDKFKIKSPSRVFKAIGGYIMEGWQLGLTNNADRLIQTANNISTSLINAVQEPIKNANLADTMITKFKGVTGTFAFLENQIDAAQKAIEDTNNMKVDESITDDDEKKLAQLVIDGAKKSAKEQQDIVEDNKNKIVKIAEATTTAITNELNKEKEAAEKVHNDKLDMMEKEYNTEIANIEKATDKKTKAIDKEIVALEEQANAESRTDERTTSKDKINVLTTKMNNTKSQADKDRIELEIQAAQKELNNKENTWDIEDQKAELEAEKTKLSEQAETKKASLKEEYDTQKANEEAKLKATDEYYNKLLETDSINAQTRYMMLTKNSNELVTLLNSYNPNWQDAGQNLGDSLLKGLNSSKQSVADAINDMIGLRGDAPPNAINSDIGGYETGTNYNSTSGLYKVDEKGFETTSNGSVAYVSQGAAISNHMQSLAAIKEEISRQVSPLFNSLKSVLYSEQSKMSNMLSNTMNTVNNTSNRGGDINFNVEHYHNDNQTAIEQTANELGFFAKRQLTS